MRHGGYRKLNKTSEHRKHYLKIYLFDQIRANYYNSTKS